MAINIVQCYKDLSVNAKFSHDSEILRIIRVLRDKTMSTANLLKKFTNFAVGLRILQ